MYIGKKILLPLCLLLLLFGVVNALCSSAFAEEQSARNIIQECKLTSPNGKSLGWLSDNRIRYGFESAKRKNIYLQITAPEPVYGLYLQWKETCDWVLQTKSEEGKWEDVSTHLNHRAQEYIEVDGLTDLRITRMGNKSGQLSIAEMQVLTRGILPESIHNWQDPHEKADILVLVAHPDDEWIFIGGTIPYYAVEREMNVTVAYLTYADKVRRHELLDGLWAGGLRHYPDVSDFHDDYRSTLNGTYLMWGEEKVKAHVVDLFRKYQPEVVITHDIDGEYGHGAHRVAADASLFAFDAAANSAYTNPYITTEIPWQVKKLYLHLWAENQLLMNWKTPMEKFNGLTPLEVAVIGYDYHETQHGGRHDFEKKTFWFKVHDGGMFDNALYGLAKTTVGLDEAKNDFLENIIVSREQKD